MKYNNLQNLSRLGVVVLTIFSSISAHAQAPATPYLLWPSPAPIAFTTPISTVQLNARAFAGPPVNVPLASLYNITGITTAGVPFYTGGYDGSSWAYSSELLGNSLAWSGITFPLGSANSPDAVSNVTIPIPAGTFSSLLLAGSLVNNATPPTGHFVLTYTDGSSTGIDQELSDWVNPRNYPGESIITCTPTRHNYDGSTDLNSVCIYGYSLPVDPTRTLASLTLPPTRNVVMLSIVAEPPAIPGTFAYTPVAGTVPASGVVHLTSVFTPASPAIFGSAQVENTLTVEPPNPLIVPTITWPVPVPIMPGDALSSTQLNASAAVPIGPVQISLPYRVNAFYPDGSTYYERGFDGSSTAFSANLLGTALHYEGFIFPLGSPSIPDAATDSTIALPSGTFKTLYLLGAGANGSQLAQPFTITYTDGSSTTQSLNLSSWLSPQNFAGETVVASSVYANLSTGQQLYGSFSVYGYQLSVDPTRVPATLTLPNNTNVIFLAAGLGSGNSFPVSGSFSYTPSAGTVIQTDTTLTTKFSPADSIDLLPASASVPLLTNSNLDFTFTAPQGTIINNVFGQSASLLFQIAPTGSRYSAPIKITLQGNIPAIATYKLTPALVAMSDGTTTVVLTIQSQPLAAQLRSGTSMIAIAFCGLLLMPLTLRRRSWFARSGLLLLMGTMLFPVGCGTGYHSGGINLTLVATDGHFTHTLPVTLNIEVPGH